MESEEAQNPVEHSFPLSREWRSTLSRIEERLLVAARPHISIATSIAVPSFSSADFQQVNHKLRERLRRPYVHTLITFLDLPIVGPDHAVECIVHQFF